MTLDMPWHRVHIENFVHYIIVSLLLFLLLTVGYTMTDIRYKWNDGLNSVQISSDVSLPQFKVLGHRQKIIEAELSTGKLFFPYKLKENSIFGSKIGPRIQLNTFVPNFHISQIRLKSKFKTNFHDSKSNFWNVILQTFHWEMYLKFTP